jgi:basic amino acid/polyamine antiporter, APA family
LEPKKEFMSNLKRSLGFPMLVFYGTGMILGAGIYSIIGKAAQKTGDTLTLGFILASLVALMTALSYAELSTLFPKAGAEFVYLRNAFSKKKWIGSTIGIAMSLSGAATAATVALAFSGYLNQFVKVPAEIVAAAILILFTGIAIIGIRTSGWVTVISTLIEIGGLAFIIYLGLKTDKFGESINFTPTMETLSGMALIIFSFFGFENIVNLAEETKKPEKALPWAIICSVLISSTLYVLISISALALLSPEKLGQSAAPLMDVARTASMEAGKILGAVALFSTANTALISLIGASRILFGMGEEGVVPKVAAKVVPKRKTPWVASLTILAVALALLPLGDLETVASISAMATMIAFFSVNVAMISLRYSLASKERPFRSPLNLGKFPLLSFIAACICLVLLTQFSATVYLIGGSLLAIVAFYFKWKERS